MWTEIHRAILTAGIGLIVLGAAGGVLIAIGATELETAAFISAPIKVEELQHREVELSQELSLDGE